MKQKKYVRILALVLVLVMCIGIFTACKKNPDDNLGSHFSETYKYLNRVYGIDINEEKKMYRKKYGVRASGIDAVMANEEIWTLFINKLQNILDIDLTKMT